MADDGTIGGLAEDTPLPPDWQRGLVPEPDQPPTARITIGGPQLGSIAEDSLQPEAFQAAADRLARRYPGANRTPSTDTEGPIDVATRFGQGVAAAPGNVGRIAEFLSNPNLYATRPPAPITPGGMLAPPYVAPGTGSPSANLVGGTIGTMAAPFIEAVMAPGDAVQGKINPMADPTHYADLGAQVATTLTAQGARRAALGGARGQLGIFGGDLSLTAPMRQLKRAQRLEAKGVGPDEIMRGTGWMKGPENKWKYEISDDQMRLLPDQLARVDQRNWPEGQMAALPLRAVVDHPLFEDAYPDLMKNVEITLRHDMGNAHASYTPAIGDIPPLISVSSKITPEQQLSAIAHEMSHMVADKQGFARGAQINVLSADMPAWKIYQERLQAMRTPVSHEEYSRQAGYGSELAPMADYKHYLSLTRNPPDYAIRAAQEYALKEAYIRSAGENEARNVQTRLRMTPEQRQQLLPWETQDIPFEDQLVDLRVRQRPMGSLAEQAVDPTLWHGVSQVKLPRPLDQMQPERIAAPAVPKRTLTPEDLYRGGYAILPVPGDRSIAGGQLTGVGGVKLKEPVPLQGGPGYMTRNDPYVWASGQGVITTLANRIKALQQHTGRDVMLSYTPMGERSVDFSHHVSDTLADMMGRADIIKKSRNPDLGTASTFDATMRANTMPPKKPSNAIEDFPGVLSDNLREYLMERGPARTKMAQLMDTAHYQKAGFPSVAEVRHAVTEPGLLHAAQAEGGHGFALADPRQLGPSGHRTYETGIGGTPMGSFAEPVPPELMWRDIFRGYNEAGITNPSRQMYTFQKGGKPETGYYQIPDKRWLDAIMRGQR